MPPKVSVVRHRRNFGDVALCGERNVTFGTAQSTLTCPACIAKSSDPAWRKAQHAKLKGQMAARRKFLLSRGEVFGE